MDIISIHIFAYAFMTIILGLVFNLSAKKGGVLVFINFLFFAWALFMLFYLCINYKYILSMPINIRLGTFEAVTNFLAPLCILAMYLNMKKK